MEKGERLLMNIDETKEVCQRVCQVEGRVWTPETNRVWHGLLEHLSFEVANKAATLALQDFNVHQVAPKHILAKKDLAVGELNALIRSDSGEDGWRSEPQPVCEAHGLKIMKCDRCIDLLVHQAGHLSHDRLHAWAKQHIYAANSLVENMEVA